MPDHAAHLVEHDAYRDYDTPTVERIVAFMDIFVQGRDSVERFDRTLHDIAGALRHALGAAMVTIWIPNDRVELDPLTGKPSGAAVRVNPAYCDAPAGTAANLPLEGDLDGSRVADCLESDRARFHGDLSAGPPTAAADVLRAAGHAKMWCVPIRAATQLFDQPNKIIAVAELSYPAGAPAEDIPAPLAELCGRLAGRAIERALLTEHDEVVQKSLEALDVLKQSKYDAMDPVATAIAESMRFEACTILLANTLARTMHVLGTTGIDSKRPRRRLQYSFGFSCSGLVARKKRIFATENLDACAVHEGPKYTDRVETPAFRQYLGAPVLSHDNDLLGVVRLRNKRPPLDESWPRCLNALDWIRIERTARVLAPLMLLMIKDMHNASMLERVRHDMDMPATMIRDSAGHLRRMGEQRLAERLPEVCRKLEDFESLAEIMLLNSELLGVHAGGGMTFDPEYIMPMGDFVAKLCKMLTPAARRKGLAGVLYVDDTFRSIPRLWLDPRHIQIALYNLLQNGIKYGDEGSFIVVEGETRKIDGETWHCISVRNQGIGVAEEDAERIFDRHFRTARAMRKNSTGLGIGLAIARAMIERHGGRLVLTSRHDPTVFTIQLPGHLAERKPGAKASR